MRQSGRAEGMDKGLPVHTVGSHMEWKAVMCCLWGKQNKNWNPKKSTTTPLGSLPHCELPLPALLLPSCLFTLKWRREAKNLFSLGLWGMVPEVQWRPGLTLGPGQSPELSFSSPKGIFVFIIFIATSAFYHIQRRTMWNLGINEVIYNEVTDSLNKGAKLL